MNGAREYCKLFPQKQKFGRLFVLPRSHALGCTFRIYVLPKDASDYNHPDAVEVYGITGGQPGWTESYGWLHRGPWVEVFEKIVEERKEKIAQAMLAQKLKEDKEVQQEKDRVQKLLADFSAPEESFPET